MRGRNRPLVALTLLAALAATPSARAEGTPSADATRADALFQEGKKLLEQGAFGAACSRLAESDLLDPTISTLGLLAACHEQAGRTASAWREYLETAKRAAAANDPRADFARQRAAALELELPKLLVQLDRPSPDVEVLKNLEPIPADQLGVELPVDPGAYEIVARAPKRQVYRVTVTAKERARLVVRIPELPLEGAPPLAPSGAEAAPRGAPPAPIAPAAAVTPAPGAAPEARNPRLPAALFAGGVGLAGIGVGIAFGVSAISKNLESTTIHETCKAQGAPPGACASGAELRRSAFTAATVSTVGFGVGLAGLGVGVALLLIPHGKTAPPSREKSAPSPAAIQVTPLAGPDGGGAVLSGRF